MNKEIDFNNLSDWFDINNYKDVRNFSRERFNYELISRKHLIYSKYQRDIDNGADIKLFKSSLLYISSFTHLNNYKNEDFIVDCSIDSYSDTDLLIDLISICRDNKAHKNLKALIQDLEECKKEYPDFFNSKDYCVHLSADEGIEGSLFNEDCIHVELSYSDEKIIDDFKLWLEKRRKNEQKDICRLSDTEFKKWRTQPRLAYIDLYLWQMITGKTLTYPKIVNLLYPKDRNMTPDNFKKTIAEKTIKDFKSYAFDKRFI